MTTRKEVIKNTARERTGITNSASSQTFTNIATPHMSATTPGNISYQGETDSNKTLTGPDDGVAVSGISGKKWGYTGDSGTSIQLDDSPGGERIYMKHHKGSIVSIDPDGSVYVNSNSKKGIGISAPFGDAYITSSGDFHIQSSSVSFKTTGDLTLDIGGNFNIKSKGVSILTDIMETTVDGTETKNVTNDSATVIGGILRTMVAGDKKEQISGNNILDVKGDYTNTITGKMDYTSQGDSTFVSNGESYFTSKNTMSIASGETLSVNGKNIENRASESNKVHGKNVSVISSSSTKIHGKNTEVVGSSEATISGSKTKLISDNGSIDLSSGANFFVSGKFTISANDLELNGKKTTISASDYYTPTHSEDSGSPNISSPISKLSSDDIDKPSKPKEAQPSKTLENTEIVDELTSKRKYPQYPHNAKYQSADATSVDMVSYDSSPSSEEVFNEYSSKNQGNLNQSKPEDYGQIPETSESDENGEGKIKTLKPSPYSIPNRNNTGTKISRYFTLGDILNGNSSQSIPNSKYMSVVKELMRNAYNVLDPLKEKFPDIVITSGYRSNSSNHITGRAFDIVVNSRNMARQAEMARYVRDHLPCEKILLEKNSTGKSHLHIQIPAGNSVGSQSIFTCGDKKCQSSTPGINLAYLIKSGARNG